ncbi:MAG: DJ-1/PfpI family protein [Desulfobacteraceae bacterium]|nr:DJ-1/PfpI family protein [Desulfobacteraceae bacterium]
MKNLAILLFDDVEVLDFAGPFEIFSVTNELNNYSLLNIYTVSKNKEPIIARNGLSVNPDFALSEAPLADFLIIPGGYGARAVLNQPDVIDWIKTNAKFAEKVMSICTGSFLLGKAGLLGGLKATTHYQVFDTLAELAPDTEIVKNKRFIDNGKILTSAGVTAGIEMSFHVVEILYGKIVAAKTAEYIEYHGSY